MSARWISANTGTVVERDPGEVDRGAVDLRDLLDAVLDGGEHPEAEQVDLEEAGVGAGVLVPLAELATDHRGRLHRDEVDQRPRRDHHAARVLGDVAWQAGDLGRQELEGAPALRDQLALGIRKPGHLLGDARCIPAVAEAGDPLELCLRQPERLAHVADRSPRAIGGEARHERCVLVAVALRDRDDQLLADVAREVEIDVRDRGQLVVEKAPEREIVRHRIDVREAGQVTDDRTDRAAAPAPGWQEAPGRVATAYLQGALTREVENLPVEQEEPREIELVDQRELALEAIARPLEQPLVARRIAVGEGVVADLCELSDRGLVAVGEVGVAIAELLGEVELKALRDLDGAGGGGRVDAGEEVGRICRRPQDALAVASPLLLAAVEGGTTADRDERVLEERAPRRMRMHVARGHGRDAEMLGQVAQSRVAPHVTALVRPL